MTGISIVVAAYRAEREIRIFLESLCASSDSDFEVCICDDASPDRTLETIRSFEGRLRLKITKNNENRGVTYSRNRALELAEAPLLLFMDADIRVPPDAIGKLRATLEAHKADVVEGVYSPVALDGGLFSDYYAAFVHHSFLISETPVEYNVFNAWLALCRRRVMKTLGGHAVVEKGVEVENETLGRRIVAGGFKLMLDPSVAADHHWGGHRKLVFIFTKRVYWWVKIFFATGLKFEDSLTTPSYGAATLCVPAALLSSALAATLHPYWGAAAAAFFLGYLRGYGPFLRWASSARGLPFAAGALVLSQYFALFASASAVYSGLEEVVRIALLRSPTLDPAGFKA
jgi:glycosyltransferase involved in cell wall biosynthesis